MADPVSIILNIALQAAIGLIMAALTPKIREEGPRLDDRQITTSTYGEEISLGYGTVLMAGNLIWGKDIEEVTLVEDIGKGGLLSKGTITTYEYYATFALAVSRRQIRDVLRLYADGKIIFDKTADDTPRADVMQGLDWRLYLGTMDQQRDPLIEADVGPNACPAYRGIAYMVFNRLPLQNFGRRIPSIRALVAYDYDETGRPSYEFEDLVRGQSFSSADLDPFRRIMISHAVDKTEGDYHHMIHEYDTGRLLYKRSIFDLNDDIVAMGGPSGFFYNTTGLAQFTNGLRAGAGSPYYICRNRAGSSGRFALIEKDTLRVVSWTEKEGNILDAFSNVEDPPGLPTGGGRPQVDGTANFDIVEVIGPLGIEYYAIFLGTGTDGFINAGGMAICRISSDGYSWVWGSGTGSRQLGSAVAAFANKGSIVAGTQRGEFRDIYISGFADRASGVLSVGPYHVFKIQLSALGEYILPGAMQGATDNYDFEPLLTVEANELTGGNTHQLWFDILSDNFVWSISGTGDFRTRGYNMAVLNEDGEPTQLWQLAESILGPGSNQYYAYDRGRISSFERVNRVITAYSMETGLIEEQFSSGQNTYPEGDGIDWPATVANSLFYYPNGKQQVDPRYGIFYYITPASRGSERLDLVVEDILDQSKLLPVDIDTTALSTVQVRGYLIARGIDYRTILEPLMSAYNFYGVEKEGKLVFDFHTSVPNVIIEEDDLLRVSGQNVFEEARGQELETPRAIYLKHRDPAKDDNKMIQGARRISFPDETMNSVGEQTVEIPLYLSVEEGARIVERLLYDSWVQRETLRFRLPPRYLRILPNDILRVTAEGRTEAVKANRVSIGSNLEIEVEGNLVDSNVYIQRVQGVNAPGAPSYTHGGVTSTLAERVTGWMLDMPLLRDGDLPDRVRGLLYFTAGVNITDPGVFPGAGLYTSYDGSSFEGRTTTTNGAPWGLTKGAIPDIPDPDWNSVQEVSIDVSIFALADRMASVTQEDMIGNDANTAALLKPNGEVEIIGYRDVELLDGNLYRLTGLMRGKRGTNSLARDYPSSGLITFILLDPLWVTGFYETLARDEQVMGYKVVSAVAGQTFSPQFSQLIKLNSLMPYEPAHPTLVTISGGYRVSWTRRTRQGGALRASVSTVSISEDSELYDLEIYAFYDTSGVGPDLTLLRTVTGLTSPSFDYTDAMVSADFSGGSLPDPIYIKVYQVSTQVGRGFSTLRTLYLED